MFPICPVRHNGMAAYHLSDLMTKHYFLKSQNNFHLNVTLLFVFLLSTEQNE
jgi:hypothetical protein